MFCPGEPIIVKCSVRSTVLRWHVGKTSFVIFERVNVYFTAHPDDERRYIYMNTAVGRLNFYRNETYVGPHILDSTIISELHMHLKDANDFIELSCVDFSHHISNIINITVFPGMLIMAYDKLICYCKFVLCFFFVFHSEVLPLSTIILTITHHFEYAMMSYHVLNWTIEDQANVNHFILRIYNFSLLGSHHSKNISIHGDMNSYIFQKDNRDSLSLSIVSLDKCNWISGISNNVSLPQIRCK